MAERHHTLQAVVDWSYQLLKPVERILFNRLSAFRSGFTLEAAEAVGGEPNQDSSVLDLLASLVDQSMVLVEIGRPVGTRYRLLETLRLYGQERLLESKELESIQQRHAAYFTGLAEEADSHLRGPEQIAWLETLETEHDNLRAALDWTANNDPVNGLRLASALWWFWITRGYFVEGREYLEKFLACKRYSQTDTLHVRAYARYIYLMSFLIDNPQLYQLAEEGLSRATRVEDPESMAISLLMMAGDPYYASDVQESFSLLEESLSLFRQSGNRWGMATTLRNLAELLEVRFRNHTEAKKLFLEAITLSRGIGDLHGISIALLMLGDIERHQGNWNSARGYYQESYSYNCELKDRYGMAGALWNLGWLAEFQNDYTQAIKLREASLQIFREIHHYEMTTLVTSYLAYLAFVTGETGKALQLCHESLKFAKETNSQRAASDAILTLGEIALSQGEPTTAFQHFSDYFANIQRYSLTQVPIIYGLEALARLAISQDQAERAVKLLGSAETLRETINLILLPNTRKNWEGSLEAARAHLDESAYAVAWAAGQATAEEGSEHVIAYALGEVGE